MAQFANRKKDIVVLRITIFILSLLFAAVVYVWITSFGGEFLIIARSTWILIAFAALLVAGSLYGLAGILVKKEINPPPAARILFTIFNPIAGIILLYIHYKLVSWVIDTMPVYELVALSLPFVGYGLLLIADGLGFLLKIFGMKNLKLGIPGMVTAGVAFLFLFAAFGIRLLLWNPSFAGGISHTPLFAEGMQEGRGYRIPSLLAFKDDKGRDIVMAFAESRADAMFDWGDIDLVARRSLDGGKTWGPIQALVDAGRRTAGNPCPVFDRDTKVLWLPFCIDNKQVWMMKSADFGLSFSRPVNITQQLNLGLKCNDSPLCMEYGTGPGIGIQLKSSRLVVPVYYFRSKSGRGAHVLYSDDHGNTWKKGGDLGAGEEPQVVERMDGSLYMNCRFKRCKPRKIGLSRDGGITWHDPFGDESLIDAQTQASLIRLPGPGNTLLFSNPAYCARGNLTLRMSNDDGKTWPVRRELYSGPSCYSQLCALPDGAILLLFESGKYDYREQLTLVRLDRDWIYGKSPGRE